MKKIYKAPVARVFNIDIEDLIAVSTLSLSSDVEADENYEGGGDAKQDLWNDAW